MQELAEHLDAFQPGVASGDLVFVGERGGVLRRSFLARVLKPAATRVGLAVGVRAGLDFHGLRHIATSLMVASGEHPGVMQGRLGHSNPVLTIGSTRTSPTTSIVPPRIGWAGCSTMGAFRTKSAPG
jgi:integrase